MKKGHDADGGDLAKIVAEIERRLPGWWWTCGNCHREAHATIGPEVGTAGPSDGVEGLAPSGHVAEALRSALEKALAYGRGGKEAGISDELRESEQKKPGGWFVVMKTKDRRVSLTTSSEMSLETAEALADGIRELIDERP